MVLEKDNAIADWRVLLGPTDASKAKITHPHRLYMFTNQTICVCLINFSMIMIHLFTNLNSIRAKCGLDTEKNCVHGSDSTKSAQREMLFFFDELATGE